MTRRLHLLAAALGVIAGLVIPAIVRPSVPQESEQHLVATRATRGTWLSEAAAASQRHREGGGMPVSTASQDAALARAQDLHDQARMLTRAELDLDERQAALWLLAASEIELRLAAGDVPRDEVDELVAARAELARAGLIANTADIAAAR